MHKNPSHSQALVKRTNHKASTTKRTAKRNPTKSKRRTGKAVSEYQADMPKIWTSATSRPSMGIKFRPIWLGTISGAAISICKRWNTNSIWQPEVSGGTGTTPGYADWASFYGFYRVIGYKYTISFTNKEAFDVGVWVANSSNDPGTTTNSTITSNPLTSWKQLSAKGGMDRCKISGAFSMAHVAGTDAVYTADSFRSLIGANPADVSWLGIGIQSFGGNLTNGVDVEFQLSQKTIMYDYLLQTPAQLQQIRAAQLELMKQRITTPSPSSPKIVQGEEHMGLTIPNTLT